MTSAAQPEPPAFAVIYPDGRWEFKPLSAHDEVEALITDTTAMTTASLPRLTDAVLDEHRLRIWANEVMLLMPDKFPINNAARRLIKAFSGDRIAQTWRGVVAIVEYDRDPHTGEIGFPQEMSEERREEVSRFLNNL